MVYMYSHCIFKGSALLCVYFTVEELERGIQDAIILEADEALLVTAQEEFDDIAQDGKLVFTCLNQLKEECTQFSYTNSGFS